ncbi:hypothetical protein DB41_KR00160 [Neochlamydia sp. TUME1]|nr:hypothetical protein [Neochlamydia sp. TUME1]KIC72193.1 hypothetical protein DB41_KR00160 [Neochlamydia sp. TUME1]
MDALVSHEACIDEDELKALFYFSKVKSVGQNKYLPIGYSAK